MRLQLARMQSHLKNQLVMVVGKVVILPGLLTWLFADRSLLPHGPLHRPSQHSGWLLPGQVIQENVSSHSVKESTAFFYSGLGNDIPPHLQIVDEVEVIESHLRHCLTHQVNKNLFKM